MNFKKLLKYLFLVVVILLYSCKSKINAPIGLAEVSFVEVDNENVSSIDSGIYSQILPFRQKLDSLMNKVLAFSSNEFIKDQPNGSLNNLAADAVLVQYLADANEKVVHVDFCLLNYGGLRYPLPQGNIRVSDVYGLMPFENEAVVVVLTGEEVRNLFEYVISSGGQPVSNCTVVAENGVFKEAFIGGQPFDESKEYSILTSDYLANGGDKMTFFLKRKSIDATGFLIRELIMKYIEGYGKSSLTITPDTSKRIIFVK